MKCHCTSPVGPWKRMVPLWSIFITSLFRIIIEPPHARTTEYHQKKIYLHYIRYHANRPENRGENIVISLSMLLINGIAHWFGHLYESVKWKRWRAFSPHICRQRHWLIIYNFWSCKCGKQSVEKLANGYHYFTNSYQHKSMSLGTSGSLTDILRGSKWDFRFFLRIKLSC